MPIIQFYVKILKYAKTRCLINLLNRYGNSVDHILFYMIPFDLSASVFIDTNKVFVSIRTNYRKKTLKYVDHK